MTIVEQIKLLYDMINVGESKKKIMRIFSILPHSSPIPIEIKDWIPCDINDIKWLVDRGWITRSGRYLFVHQLVQQSIRLQEAPSLDDCRSLTQSFSTYDFIPENMNYMFAAERLSLSDALIHFFKPAPEDSEFAAFLGFTANFHVTQGDYPLALEYYQKALAIREKVLGLEHPSTAITYNNLAGVYEDQGDYPLALEYFLKSYAILFKTFNEDHPHLQIVFLNLKTAYFESGNSSLPFEDWLKEKLEK